MVVGHTVACQCLGSCIFLLLTLLVCNKVQRPPWGTSVPAISQVYVGVSGCGSPGALNSHIAQAALYRELYVTPGLPWDRASS